MTMQFLVPKHPIKSLLWTILADLTSNTNKKLLTDRAENEMESQETEVQNLYLAMASGDFCSSACGRCGLWDRGTVGVWESTSSEQQTRRRTRDLLHVGEIE